MGVGHFYVGKKSHNLKVFLEQENKFVIRHLSWEETDEVSNLFDKGTGSQMIGEEENVKLPGRPIFR